MMRTLGALVVLACFAAGNVDAQDPNYTMKFTPDLSGPSGTIIPVQCLIDVQGGAIELAGWSLSVCHDYLQVQPVSAVPGLTTLTAKNGGPADFESTLFEAGSASSTGGVNHGVVICFTSCATVPAGTDYQVVDMEYSLDAPNGTLALLQYCDTAEVQGQTPVETLVVQVGGTAVTPIVQDATIDIDVVPFILAAPDLGPILQGDPVSVPVRLTNSEDVYGFSFGMSHDAGALTLSAVSQGADLLALQAGGAEYFETNLAPNGGTGYTVGSVISISSVVVLPPSVDFEIVLADYTVAPAAPVGITPLDFVASLSPPAPAPPVAIAVSIGETSVVPNLEPGSILVEEGSTGVQFVRGNVNGDANIDLSDPIFLLAYLFSMGTEPTCLDTGDLDDNGGIDISDPIYLLSYQFSMGPEPAAPFPSCGVDPDGDADGLTCLSNASCP